MAIQNRVHGGTEEQKDEAMMWLTKLADDKANPDSAHANLLLRLLRYYVGLAGDVA